MKLLSPWGLAALGLAIPIILLHILKPRRETLAVNSVMLWKDLERPVTAAAPWQRLRRSWLLFLQLLVVALLAMVFANPARPRQVALAQHTVFVVDTSGSMAATDVEGGRLKAAIRRADQLFAELPTNGVASVVSAGPEPVVLVSATADKSTFDAGLDRLRTAEGPTDWSSAFSLAESMQVPGQDIGMVMISDGGILPGEQNVIPAGTRFEPIGSGSSNVAVASVVASPSAQGLSVHANLRNYGTRTVVVEARVDGDGLEKKRQRVSIAPDSIATLDAEIPRVANVDVWIESEDALAADNHGVAVSKADRNIKVALAGETSPFMSAVVESLPAVDVVAANAKPDLVIYEGVAPPASISAPALVINAPNGVAGITVKGTLDRPAITSVQTDDPLVAGIDFSSVSIGTAQQVDPGSAKVVVAAEGAPLYMSTQLSGQPVAYLAFALANSDLPLQVAFPLMVDRAIAALAVSAVNPPTSTVGARLPVEVAAGGKITPPDGRTFQIPAEGAAPVANAAGLWTFAPSAPAGGEAPKPRVVAVNASPRESAIAPNKNLIIPERVQKFDTKPPVTWRSVRAWLIAALMAAMVLEWLVARRRVGVSRGQWRVATGLRCLALGLLGLAILGVTVPRKTSQMATMFLIDGSASVGRDGREEALTFVSEALAKQPDNSIAGVALFGGDARLEATMREQLRVSSLDVKIEPSQTDIAAALRLAGAVMPADSLRRVVLISDGRPTKGDALVEATRLGSLGIAIDTVSIDRGSAADAAVTAVDGPQHVTPGDTVTLDATIESNMAAKSTVTLFRNDTEVERKPVDLKAGANKVSFVDTVPTSEQKGTVTYSVEVSAPGDQVAENDSGQTVVEVQQPAKVLIVSSSKDATAIGDALTAGGIGVDTVAPDELTTADQLARYQSIVLDDVSIDTLTPAAVTALTTATRDMGRGLVTIGGRNSYALGGYRDSPLEDLLPVISDVMDPKRRTTVAEALAVDLSGSMGACHCGANGNGMMSGGGGLGLNTGGANKTDISRAAATRSVDALTDQDFVGVLGVTNVSDWIVAPANLGSDGDKIREAIDGLRHTNSGTSLDGSLTTAAEGLMSVKAGIRHIILFTDGFAPEGEIKMLAQDAAKLKAKGITVSLISTGETPSEKLLSAVAEAGGGRFYPGKNLNQIPQVMAQETVLASRNFINEGDFLPEVTSNRAVVRSLTSSPKLLGYIATTSKPTAETLLRIGPERDPLLASWQNGLGRSTAWTSDGATAWSKRWASWDGYVDFWSRVVKDTFPAAGESGAVTTRFEGDSLKVAVEGSGTFGDGSTATARVSGPGADGVEVTLERTGDNSFEGTVPASASGSYRVGVAIAEKTGTAAVLTGTAERFYSAEYRPGRADKVLLAQLSSVSKGRTEILPKQAFDRAGLESGTVRREAIGWYLALAALCWLASAVLGRLSFTSHLASATAAARRGVDTVARQRGALKRRGSGNASGGVGAARGSSAGRGAGGSSGSGGGLGGPTTEEAPSEPPVAAPRSDGTVGSLLANKRNRGSSKE